MTIELINQLFTGVELIGAVLILGYMLVSVDWKQEREFDRLMREMHQTFAPRRRASPTRSKPN